MRRRGRSPERGAALRLAVVAIVILLAIGVGLLSLGRAARRSEAPNASSYGAARCAADAGLTMALFDMNKKLRVKPWNEATLPQATDVQLPHFDATCSYRVTGSIADGYAIRSLGRSGDAEREVSATIELHGAFENAILTNQQLVLKSYTIIDGYDSTDPTESDITVNIGSQSNSKDSVVLNMGVQVKGCVFVGTGAELDTAIQDRGAITGERFATRPQLLPPVTAPTLPNKAALKPSAETVTITPEDNGRYPQIYLHQPSRLEVTGGDVVLHVAGDIRLENSCEVIIEDGSTLTIYTDGDIHCHAGSGIGTRNPSRQIDTLQIYATGRGTQYFNIKAKRDFAGKIYAPNTNIDLYAKADVYGSVVANSFSFLQGGDFHYDEALRENISVNDEAVVFTISRRCEETPDSQNHAEKPAPSSPN